MAKQHAKSSMKPVRKPAKKAAKKLNTIQKLHGLLAHKARPLSLLTGIVGVLIWTLYRHMSNGVNFDVVGQVGLAQQWSAGFHSGAQLGATNYLLKIPFYMVVNHLHFLSPMNRLLLLAAVFNVATFVLLFVLFEKAARLLNSGQRSWLYIAFIWLASVMGSVFWADYANSRNLETAGGLLFVYLVMKYYVSRRHRTLLWLVPVGSIVFFADNLQFYVCGFGVMLFAVGCYLFRRTKAQLQYALAILGATVLSYAGALGLRGLAKHFLHVMFFDAPSSRPHLSVAYVVSILHGLAIGTLKLFGADFLRPPYGVATIREGLNFLVLMGLIIVLLRVIAAKPRNFSVGLILTIIGTNYAVFAASGQVAQWETQRYLIMVPLLLVLLIATNGQKLDGKAKLWSQYAWLSVALVSIVMVAGALLLNWPTRHAKDARIYDTVSYLQAHHYAYALASREDGITTSYFSQGKLKVLPMGCSLEHTLHPTSLFYDNAVFKSLYNYSGSVPIIVPTEGIHFGSNVCSEKDIITQFGAPTQRTVAPRIGTVLVYDANDLRLADIDHMVGQPRHRKPKLRQLKPTVPVSALTVLPDAIKLTNCPEGILDVVVAHPDDDILFMNPYLSNHLKNGSCVRGVYVTAADDGRHNTYWQAREKGIKAAYAFMFGAANDWTDSTADIDGYTTFFSTLNGNPSVNLVFLHLPDGGVEGRGFADTGYESLKMSATKGVNLQTVDGANRYDYFSLVKLISTFIYNDQPKAIFTHMAYGKYTADDHSDHTAVGRLALQAASNAKSIAPISMFVGYPDNGLPANLTPEVTAYKRDVFNAYASDDEAICVASDNCAIEQTYGRYFSRSYKIDIASAQNQVALPTQNNIQYLLYR